MRDSSSVAGTAATCGVAEAEQGLVHNGPQNPATWV